MKAHSILFAVALFALSRAQRDLNIPQRSNLIVYLPLDRLDGLNDVSISNKRPESSSSSSARLWIDFKGPHGQYGTAYSVVRNGDYIASYKCGWQTQFTMSFYLSTKAEDQGAVLTYGWTRGINIMYEAPGTLVIFSGENKVAQLGFSPSGDSQVIWHFFSITLLQQRLRVYDEAGTELLSVPANFELTTDTETTITLGDTYMGGGRWLRLNSSDALSCFMLFKTALTSSEIAQLPAICKQNAKPVLWPRSDALYGFWPLNNAEFVDFGLKSRHGTANSKGGYQKATGPYGRYDTAVKVISQQGHLFEFQKDKDLTIDRKGNKFTVAFHFAKRSDSEKGCIFEFLDEYNTDRAFQICYANYSFIEVYANGHNVGQYQMLLQKGAWAFVAFVYNGTTLTVYSKHGVFSPPNENQHICASNTFNNKGIRVGYSTKVKQQLSDEDSLACLMVYETDLTAMEVKLARESCRVVLGSGSCGTRKTASQSLISENSIHLTSTPAIGDFPYIGSLRYLGNHICSVTVIDQFWGLSSGQCFALLQNTSDYEVVIGAHDLSVDGSFAQKRSIDKVVIQPTNKASVAGGELVLISFSEPFDFTSEWINDACFIANDIKSDLKIGSPQIVHGWGSNGRSALVKASLPRYFCGTILTDKQCKRTWVDDFIGGNVNYCFQSLTTDMDVPCDNDLGAPLLALASENLELGFSERLVQMGMFYKRDVNCTALHPALFVGIDNPMFGWITENIACAVPGVMYPESCPQ